MSDFIISFLSGVPRDVLALFAEPPVLLAVPSAPMGQGRQFYAEYLQGARDGKGRLIPGLYARAGGKGAIGRVAAFGFSNGVDSGIRQLIEGSDAGKIDFLGCFDGIHGSWQQPPAKGRPGLMMPAAYSRFLALAQQAASVRPSSTDKKVTQMVVTHSSVEPAFPSTTETANYLWDAVLKTAPSDYEALYWQELDQIVYPGGYKIPSVDTAGSGKPMPVWTWSSFADGWYDRRVCNGFSVFGWGDPGVSRLGRFNARCRDRFNDTADHVFQGHAVLNAVLKTYVAARWNPLCGPLTGLGESGGQACAPGEGMRYEEGPDDVPDPGPGPSAQPAPTCPYPPSGEVLVGSKQDPCAPEVRDNAPEPPGPWSPEPIIAPKNPLWKLMALAAGGYGGYALTKKYLLKR